MTLGELVVAAKKAGCTMDSDVLEVYEDMGERFTSEVATVEALAGTPPLVLVLTFSELKLEL